MNRPKNPEQQRTGLGERLRKLREARGLTQPKLAQELDIAPGTVSRWERETGSPQAEQLLTLADYFDVSLDYLILGAADEDVPTTVHSPQLHEFLTMTAAGRYAREHGLVRVLMHLPQPASVDFYRQVTVAIRTLIEEAEADATPKTEQLKKPTK
jgi:transcriptional regulator with XRE-family HTH domain